MTPQELAAAIETRRRELGLTLWRLAVQMDVGEDAIRRLRHGGAGDDIRDRAEEWLRRQAPPRKE
ncbi:hypothetical protein [Nonomuraea sp. bgisy101]|uniref:hypothetical protein n=1 Tax=Nonomuraea sp. bgisy101 TaxID=3413784 RepID=UPI003D75EB78